LTYRYSMYQPTRIQGRALAPADRFLAIFSKPFIENRLGKDIS
jgi:hypothetical protein